MKLKKLDTHVGTMNSGSETKLEIVRQAVQELLFGYNNLIDYLSDKEASKGECDLSQCRHCKKDGRSYLLDEKCPCFTPKPQLKEESLKEDEWKELSDLIHDAIYGGEVRGVDVIQHINKRFVSKVKIKREIHKGYLSYSENCGTPYDMVSANNMALTGLLDSLGLEEL